MNGIDPGAPGQTVSVGGIVWDPGYPLDFSMSAVPACVVTNPVDGTLRGFGFVATLNGTPPSIFCPGGELAFLFSGYVPLAVSPDGATSYTGGRVDFFVLAGVAPAGRGDPLAMSADEIGRGTPWLSLAGSASMGSTSSGSTLRTLVDAAAPPNLACVGQLLVVGGVAAPWFATHTQPGGADLAFSGSFNQPRPGAGDSVFGTASFFGATQVTGHAKGS